MFTAAEVLANFAEEPVQAPRDGAGRADCFEPGLNSFGTAGRPRARRFVCAEIMSNNRVSSEWTEI